MSASSTDRPLRAVIIGYGLAGAVFHAPLIDATPEMVVASIVTNNPERGEHALHDYPNATVLSSPDEIWRHPSRYDLVVIATPNRVHVPLALASIDAGLPVVVDKPMAASVADAGRVIAIAKEKGVPLTVFQNRRWDNDFLTVRHIIDADLLGQITRFESRFERYRRTPRPQAWRELPAPEEAGGLLYDLGSHLIDQALQLFGVPTHVYAEVERRRPGALVDDDSFVALRFADGVRAHLWMSSVARIQGPRVRLSGLLGTYEKWGLDPQEPDLVAGMRPGDPQWGREPRDRWGRLSTEVNGLHFDTPLETLPGAYEQFYILLRDALVADGPPPVDPASVVSALRVIEAAKRSAETGTVVTL
jgi:scyllo-inositol 2-dehydrogenase (NADP+)